MNFSQRIIKNIKLLEEEEQKQQEQKQQNNPEQQTNKITPEQQREFDNLITALKESSYGETVDKLKQGSAGVKSLVDDETLKKTLDDEKLKFILSFGFGGPLADVKLKQSNLSLPVANLKPTQNQIGLPDSLEWSLSGKSKVPTDAYYTGKTVTINTAIVTFNKEYVIDGHHRWSQAYCMNPNCKINAINYEGDISPLAMLKVVQATIASNQGKIPQNDANGINLLTSSKEAITKEVQRLLNDKVVKTICSYKNLPDKNAVVEFIVNNCMNMQEHNKPIADAPPRSEMPQTDKDQNCLPDLKQVTNIGESYSSLLMKKINISKIN